MSAIDVIVTKNEILTALNNKPDEFILALVEVGGDKTRTTYLKRQFVNPSDFAANAVILDIAGLMHETRRSYIRSRAIEGNATQTKALLTFEYLQTGDVLKDVKDIIQKARQFVAQNVNFAMIYAYWLVGGRIVVEKQNGKRAKYGAKLLERLSRDLSGVFGDGFTEPNLRNIRIFYQTYPTEEAIRNALSIKLSSGAKEPTLRIQCPDWLLGGYIPCF